MSVLGLAGLSCFQLTPIAKARFCRCFGPSFYGRSHVVSCADQLSSSRTVTCGVSPGSVLGPLLFRLYSRPLEQFIKRHALNYHLFADDARIYLSFDPHEAHSVVSRLNHCLSDIGDFLMAANLLKINNDETELLVCQPKQLAKVTNLNSTGRCKRKSSPCAIILGVYYDLSLSFKTCMQKLPQQRIAFVC